MSRVRSLPYLTPDAERIKSSGWQITTGGEERENLANILPDWDPAVVVWAENEVIIDIEGIFNDCQLNSDATLRLVSAWHSRGSGLKRSSMSVELPFSEGVRTVHLTVQALGTDLANDVDLLLLLVLHRPGNNPQPFAPKLTGSTLFKHVYSVQLEGEGSRFPTEVIDFTGTRFPNEAAWALEWDANDLEQSIMGDVRLYINSQHNRVRTAVSQTGEDGYDIREAIRLDVGRTLIHGALANQQFVSDPDNYSQGSVGDAVFSMLRMLFPQEPITDLQVRAQQSQMFDLLLQAKLRAFWDSAS